MRRIRKIKFQMLVVNGFGRWKSRVTKSWRATTVTLLDPGSENTAALTVVQVLRFSGIDSLTGKSGR
jgi:hypothetical protein